MEREFSAGGVLVRRLRGRWVMAAIRPRGKPAGVWALPKGRIDPGERGEQTALREVAEETGAHGRSAGRLGDVRKVVSFFLIHYEGGRLGDVPRAFRHEIADVRWLPLEEARRLLAYPGERRMAESAWAVLDAREGV